MAASTVYAVAAVISAVAGGYSAVKSKQASDKQQDMQKEQARQERAAAQTEAEQLREKGRRVMAAQRAALGGSGIKVDEGTGDALQKETKKLAEQDAMNALKGGANRSKLLEMSADITGLRGQQTVASGIANVASGVAGDYGGYKRLSDADNQAASINASTVATRTTPKYSLLNGTGANTLKSKYQL